MDRQQHYRRQSSHEGQLPPDHGLLDDLAVRQDSEEAHEHSRTARLRRWLHNMPLLTTLLPHKSTRRDYFLQDVEHTWMLDIQLFCLTFATGIMDAMTFNIYHVMTSKQTGNTLFIALYALGHDQVVEENVATDTLTMALATSIILFLFSATAFAQVAWAVGGRRRIWLIFAYSFQTLLLFSAIAVRHFVSDTGTGLIAVAIVALLALNYGGQVAMSSSVHVPELNTTMITGALITVVTDKNLWKPKNLARDRRLIFFLCLLGGSFVGAALVKKELSTLAMLISGIMKACVSLSFFFNPAIPRQPIMLED